MHPVVIKKEILDRDPWVATSLYEALIASRKAYNEFMEQPHRLSFAWGRSYLEEERKFFGKDPFYQGLKENYNDVENLIKFADQQGMLGRKLSVEELFTENTQNHLDEIDASRIEDGRSSHLSILDLLVASLLRLTDGLYRRDQHGEPWLTTESSTPTGM